jgi:GntR family transcriptional regulator
VSTVVTRSRRLRQPARSKKPAGPAAGATRASQTARSPNRPIARSNRVVPLYHQVQHLIRYRIGKGEYLPGAQIPSENQLCRELDVSRVTVREALRELVRERLLVKVQGKGTFVALSAAKELPAIKYTGFLEDIYERVRRMEVKHVSMDRIPLPEDLRTMLQLGPTETELIRIKRLRHVNDGPFSFTINYLPVSIGSRLHEQDLYRTPLLEILQDELKVPIVRAQETVEAAPADPEVAAQLDIAVLFPVMHIRRVMFTEHDKPFELVETFYRADKYQYSVNLIRVKHDGRWRWSQQG